MPQKDRVIYHVDCNAFYASVEELLHPKLKQVPMAVCGNPESRRGIILAKNELAKGFGVKTAETIWQAKRKCPHLVLAPARHHLYRQYSERVNAIYAQYTDQVERFGIDESYLDVTGSLHLFGGDSLRLAHEIRRRVPRETGLTVSVGVSFNKLFAKVASDMKKPDAVSVLGRGNYRDVLWPLPAGVLMMVGKVTEKHLNELGIFTVGDLAHADEGLLRQVLGKLGEQLYHDANGEDESPVLHIGEEEDVHSVGNGITFKRDLVRLEDFKTALAALADTVAPRLRRYGLKCATVQLTIKDPSLKIITRQRPLPAPSWLAKDLAAAALDILRASWKLGAPVRMLTVTGLNLMPAGEATEQLSFFGPPSLPESRKRHEKLERAVDGIRERYGKGSISPASLVGNDLGINEDYGGGNDEG